MISIDSEDYDITSSFVLDYDEDGNVWKTPAVEFMAAEIEFSLSDVYSDCAFDDPEEL